LFELCLLKGYVGHNWKKGPSKAVVLDSDFDSDQKVGGAGGDTHTHRQQLLWHKLRKERGERESPQREREGERRSKR